MLDAARALVLAGEVLKALRGARTQVALSRALGFKSNVVFAWESGRDEVTLSRFFSYLETLGHSPRKWLERFGRGVVHPDLRAPTALPEYLRSLSRHLSLKDLSASLGVSRYVVSRWLSGKTNITLAEFLRYVEATTLGMLDLVALLVDPRELPSVAKEWQRLEAARRSARENPWSHAIVHMVELPSYRALEAHEPGWFASRLGISMREEEECLELLVELGRLVREGERYLGTSEMTVDTRPDPDATRRLASFWLKQGAERVLAPSSGRFAFNTFGIARRDLDRVRDLGRRYFAELRSIVSESAETEAVFVATFGLFPLAEEVRAERTPRGTERGKNP